MHHLKIILLLIFSSLLFTSCKNWEYDIEKHDIHFKKISQSKRGTIIGFMSENQSIQGYPCEKGWIHFRPNWELLSFQFSKPYNYNGTEFPAKTWIHRPYHDGRTDYVISLPYDMEIQGHLCGGSGGYKGIHTGFYGNGKLRSFFPPKDVIIQGVPCEASLLENINLYENGKLQQCKLSQSFNHKSKTYRKGSILNFDKMGNVKDAPKN